MPVEIRELIIRAVAVDDGTREPVELTEDDRRDEQERIVQECVRQVLAILRRREER